MRFRYFAFWAKKLFVSVFRLFTLGMLIAGNWLSFWSFFVSGNLISIGGHHWDTMTIKVFMDHTRKNATDFPTRLNRLWNGKQITHSTCSGGNKTIERLWKQILPLWARAHTASRISRGSLHEFRMYWPDDLEHAMAHDSTIKEKPTLNDHYGLIAIYAMNFVN